MRIRSLLLVVVIFPLVYFTFKITTVKVYARDIFLQRPEINKIKPIPTIKPIERKISFPLDKNILGSKEIAWGTGWENYRSYYGGNEFRFSFINSKKLTFTASSSYYLYGQGIIVEVDNKEYILESPNIDEKVLTIIVDNVFVPHKIRVRHFCSGSTLPCDLSIKSILIDRLGILLSPSSLPPKTLAILGDSITVGWGRFNFSYAASDKLGYQLHNAGIFGSTVSKKPDLDCASDRYQKDIVSYKPNLIVVFLGTNDLATNTSLEIFQRDYQKLIGGIKDGVPGATIVTLGLLLRKDFNKESIEKYTQVIKKVSESKGISFIDTYDWLTIDDLMDVVHPSLPAQEKIVDKFYQAIFSIIKK